MKRLRSILLALAVGLLIAGIVACLWAPTPAHSITPLGIHVVSLGDSTSRIPVGECIVSNSNDRTIRFWATAAQVRTNGLWPDGLVFPPVRFTELRPRQTTHLTFLFPSNAVAWRLPIFWTLRPPFRETLDETLQQNMSAFLAGRPLPGVRLTRGITQAWTNYLIVITNSE